MNEEPEPITDIHKIPNPLSFRRALVLATDFSLLLISIISANNMWKYLSTKFMKIYDIPLLIFSASGITYVVFL